MNGRYQLVWATLGRKSAVYHALQGMAYAPKGCIRKEMVQLLVKSLEDTWGVVTTWCAACAVYSRVRWRTVGVRVTGHYGEVPDKSLLSTYVLLERF